MDFLQGEFEQFVQADLQRLRDGPQGLQGEALQPSFKLADMRTMEPDLKGEPLLADSTLGSGFSEDSGESLIDHAGDYQAFAGIRPQTIVFRAGKPRISPGGKVDCSQGLFTGVLACSAVMATVT